MARAVGLAIAAFGPLLVAGILVPFRNDLASANVVLVFVLVVVLGAAVGTRWSGAIGAVIAAMSYDFFFTHPYQSLKIDSADDIQTTVLLLVIGLVVAELVTFTRRHRAARPSSAATRSRGCTGWPSWWRPTPTPRTSCSRCRPSSSGCCPCTTAGTRRRRTPRSCPSSSATARSTATTGAGPARDYTLPDQGAEIPVLGRGREFGRLVLIPDVTVGVSIEERVVAVALADQLGAAFAADSPVS